MQYQGHFALWAPPSQRLKVPLNVRSVGRHDVDPEWHEKRKKKWFVQLFWTVEGQAEFKVGPARHRVKPGDIFLYYPGDTHDFRSITSRWICCWITWDHADSQRWVEAFDLTKRVNHREPCPQWLFEEAATALRENVPQGQRRAAQAAHAILLEASIHRGQGPRSNPIAERARTHLDHHFHEASLSMESLAEYLNVHRTTLFRAFQGSYGVSPSIYLHNRRMESALALLHRSGVRIKEAAERSGFNDPNYFSRAVKKATGLTPKEFQAGATS